MSDRDTLRLLLTMAWRSLRSHRTKTLIVGSIMLFGTFLWTTGSALLSSVDRSMSQTIVDSLSGHLQVYEADTRDQLALFGGGTFGAPDIGEISNVGALKAALADVPGIRAVVPMGTTFALLGNESELDRSLSELRQAVRDDSPMGEVTASVRYLVGRLLRETRDRVTATTVDPIIAEQLDALEYALAATFWSAFKNDPYGRLEYLDTRVAPIGAEGRLVYMRLLGTDITRYREAFEQFTLKEGEVIADGAHGLMLSTGFFDLLKNPVAREIDELDRLRREEGATFAADPSLRDRAERAKRQYKRVLAALQPAAADDLAADLRRLLGSQEQDLDRLLQDFLSFDDANFADRRSAFYDVVAPRIRMFPVQIGDIVTVRAFTRSGYLRAINLPLTGLFSFRGMEDSDLANTYNMIDLMSFRQLYGALTAGQRIELADLKSSLDLQEVDRESAEDALFGGGGSGDLIVEVTKADWDVPRVTRADEPADPGDAAGYTLADIDRGLALHAAIVAEDPAAVEQLKEDIEAAIARAGLPYRVVDWQQAAGFIGQLTMALRVVLLVGMFVIFLVALVVINNTVLISTIERTGEIGTLRAIGAQRSFVLAMFMFESTAIAVVGGLIGSLIGGGMIAWLGQVGIPAFSRQLNFLFGGPRLFPSVGPGDLVGGFLLIVGVSLAATWFPARAATRIQPVEAMQTRE